MVSLEQAVAAPLATRKLADAGARVIKVERPGGDFARGYDRVVGGGSAYFVWLNRGKESVVLDLKEPGDAALLRRMIGAADVFVQNLAPGAAERAGLGSAALRREHPTLVTCSISGYGREGAWARMKAYDNLVQGETALQAVTGSADAPARVGISVCDIAAGMHAYGAVLEALLRRERTGEGAALEVSLFDSVADWMAVPYLHWTYGGVAPARTGLDHPSIAPYGPFRCADGHVVLLAVQNEREWRRLCETALERAELAADARFADNPSRVAHREALRAEIEAVLSRLPVEAVLERLDLAHVAYGRVNEVGDFAEHPQLRLAGVSTPDGDVRLPADPVLWPEDRDASGGAGLPRVPSLDEHGVLVRREFSDDAGGREARPLASDPAATASGERA